ncbi:hypothetical protein GPECTOR_10g951 [Gonium pectorale]|uniref:Fatty acid desaturase domain-containing protein n=1 Tax=Gonium pectorale TaxID=33097 RepID=A0A150GR56_GONPE|nr:hypothetical protein GPECTOR_10g951 [Gonium pectorale]|eukprot:KXZ52319.1 hypothetical protein GPECTOR_10g951 [Gonium pectorale]
MQAFASGAEPWVKCLIAGSGPLLLHGLGPLLDFLAGERPPEPLPSGTKSSPPDSLSARLVPTLTVLAHLAVAAAAYAAVATAPVQPLLLGLMTVTLGISAVGCQAAAHELIHSRNPVHLAVAAVFLTLYWWYPYYRAHHQHHLTVCTPSDYTSAHKGRDVYSYTLQYIPGTYSEVALTAGLFLAFGPLATAAHLGASFILLTYMSVFDYVLHYGLSRPEMPGSGGRRFMHVTDYNSWSSLYPVENAMLFRVLYHGDHHIVGNKSYAWLRPSASAPTFPMPINLLAMATFVPPLWSAVMDKRADEINRKNLEHLGLVTRP